MANVKISELGSATTPLGGTELIEIVQGGVNKKVAVSEVGSGTVPTLQEILTEGNESTTEDAIFRLDADKYLKINRNNQVLEFWDENIDAVNAITSYSFNSLYFGDGTVYSMFINKDGLDFQNTSGRTQIISDNQIQIQDVGGSISVLQAGALTLQNNIGTHYIQITSTDIIVDGVYYALPTGASSPLATLADITGGSATWGGITGTLSDQTDLNSALGGKQDVLTETNFGTFMNARTAKNTLVDADEVISDDSADSNKAKKTSWLNVWTNYLKGKADALYATLSMSAYSMRVNNTNASANATEITFRQSGQTAYTLTPTFPVGSAPTGVENKTYNWQRVGNKVSANFTFDYASTGSGLNSIVIPFPSDMPSPVVPTGFSGASVILYIGSAQVAIGLTASAVSSSDIYSALRRNSANTAFEFVANFASSSYSTFRLSLDYYTA